MTVISHRPFSAQLYYNGGPWGSTSGSVEEYEIDNRPPVARTPKGTWRPPTGYYRNVRRNSHTVNIVADSAQGPWKETFTGYQDFGGGWYVALPAVPQYLVDRAETNALSKLKSMDINFVQALAERKQTARLIRSGIDVATRQADDVWKEIRKLRKLSNLNPSRLLKEIASLWLAYQYGVKPLVSDCYGAISELMDNEEISGRYRAKCIGTAQETEDFLRGPFAGGYSLQFLVDQRVRRRYRVKVRLDYEADNASLARAARLGITNPALIAWELLPFSFVVDWFYPIGNYLSLLDATNGWTFKGGSLSVTRRQVLRPTSARVRYPEYGQTGYVLANGRGTEVYFTRSVYTSSPFPNRPHFNDKSSGTHVMNGIALLSAAIAGRGAP